MPDRYKEKLIIFTRYPETGKTKTRLIAVLGEAGAADLQRKMTEHTLSRIDRLTELRKIIVEIRFEGGDEGLMRGWLGPNRIYQPQGGGDLGSRMRMSFEESFETEGDVAVIIGTDIPDINESIIHQAFDLLKQKDMVLGPAKDGGYYLIGLRRNIKPEAVSDLFSGIGWGTDTVLKSTMGIAARLGLDFSLLKVLEDIDRPEDIPVWERSQMLSKQDLSSPGISVIIPAINEAAHIEKALQSIRFGKCAEVILVDGGSSDDTVALARSMGAKVITATPPRAHQLNEGAKAADGKVLLFLHADARLPEKYDEHIIACLEKPGIACGAFKLRIDSPRKALRLVERLANFRSGFLKMPYGDQAIFIYSELFHQMGGFPDMPIMEDFEFIRRLQKNGKIITLPQTVFTSSRRWDNFGVIKTTLTNQLVIIGYLLGVSPKRIARWYRHGKGVV